MQMRVLVRGWGVVAAMAATGFAIPAVAAPDKAACAAAARYSDAHRGVSVLVLQDGKIVCDAHQGTADTPYELWSGTKSFVGVMAAAAVQDGLMKLEEPASATLVEWRDDPVKSKITLRQLLSMTSGQPSQIGRPPTYRGALDVALTAPPGARFIYGATPMQTFGEVLRRKLVAAGKPGDLVAYIDIRVLRPIGVHYAGWRRGADGNALLPQGVQITAREWAKFGEFIRAGGKAGGKQLVDPATFAAMFQGSAANPGYGLTWWLPHASKVPDPVTASTDIGRRAAELPSDLVVAAGAGDQRLYVIPSRHITIVRQALLDLAGLAAGRIEPSGWSDADFLQILLAPPAR